MSELKISEVTGFKPPCVTFEKDDPRGPEYGSFEAEIIKEEIQVTKWHNGNVAYEMYFKDTESFEAWAKDCT